MVNEGMVRHVIGVMGARALLDITTRGWEDYLNEDIERFHRSTRAHIVWDYMIKRCEESLLPMAGVERVERHQRPSYALRGLLALRPKMHDRDLLTRNYPTPAQRGVKRTSLFAEFDQQNIMFGYKLDAAEAGIEQCVITSPADEWVIDLDDLAAGNLAPITQTFEMPEYDAHWRSLPSIGTSAES
jgi:hypothetical protein